MIVDSVIVLLILGFGIFFLLRNEIVNEIIEKMEIKDYIMKYLLIGLCTIVRVIVDILIGIREEKYFAN
jgi:hypothetical protein